MASVLVKYFKSRFPGVCMRLQILMITPIRKHNSNLICEVFQIKVSDGLVHPLGSRQNVNLYPAVVITGPSFQEFVCV